MLGVRRPSLVRQMAFRQDSKETELNVRHSHLAPPTVAPDSPRPQKDAKSTPDLTYSSLKGNMPKCNHSTKALLNPAGF
ncbi:unnamed protein product [Heligmosomoides polygyrus]|uniref:Uncharacterized protein n=1 Tax=Heligmosomoides polygyrus TaxID=6339 RepID=A0A183FY33_HELPZ|nr:unnamed protein product [Heligmosomoides polygyrus]